MLYYPCSRRARAMKNRSNTEMSHPHQDHKNGIPPLIRYGRKTLKSGRYFTQLMFQTIFHSLSF